MLQTGSLPARVLALALLGAAIAAAYLLIAVPTRDAYRQTGEAIKLAEALLQRQRALAAQGPLLVTQIEEEKGQADALAGYLQGPSDALAAAQLQDRLKAVVEAARGELRSTRILPAEAVEASPGMRRATLQVQMIIAVDGLAEILYRLEGGQPYVLIEELSVRNERERRRRGEPDLEPTLDVGLKLSGFVREGLKAIPASGIDQQDAT